MICRLNHITNWLERAKQANWCAAKLARNCDVSLRTLQRYFSKQMGKSPKAWLIEQRHQEGVKMLKGGFTVKETAGNLKYGHFNNFSRDYKVQAGCCPTDRCDTSPKSLNVAL